VKSAIGIGTSSLCCCSQLQASIYPTTSLYPRGKNGCRTTLDLSCSLAHTFL